MSGFRRGRLASFYFKSVEAFFDEEHNVTGSAPNDIELHPVIYIKFR